MPFKKNPPLYTVWQSMRRRCLNPKFKQWSDYGGRGISICPEWDSYKQFEADMSPKPPGTSLDRIDNDGPYSPANCRWATRTEQSRNQRRTRFVEIDGKRLRAADIALAVGIKTDTFVGRVERGMPLEKAAAKVRYVNTSGLAKAVAVRSARQKAKTHCKRGHEFTPENTYINGHGGRVCRKCHAAKVKRQREASSGPVRTS